MPHPLLFSFGGPQSAPEVVKSISVQPTRVPLDDTVLVTFTGVGTAWTTVAPDLSATGVAGVSFEVVDVVSDTSLIVSVTTGTTAGTIVWADAANESIETRQVVGGSNMPQRAGVVMAWYIQRRRPR